MAETLQLLGSISVAPSLGNPSGFVSHSVPLFESDSLARSAAVPVAMSTDSPVSVPFGTITNAHFVLIKASAKVKVTLTSADGSAQAVPCDTVLLVHSKSVPVTAITLTRVAGVTTSAEVLLGERP